MQEALMRRNMKTMRLRDHESELVEKAASHLMMSETEFMRSTVLIRARRVLEQAKEAGTS